MYKREEKLDIYRRIGVTKDVYVILRKRKSKTKISMAKLICNLVLKKYGESIKSGVASDYANQPKKTK